MDSEKKWKVEAPLVDCVPGLPPFQVTDLPVQFVHPEELTDPSLKFMMDAFGRAREAHTIFVHSAYELESQVFDALQANGFPIHAVGPFLDSPSQPSSDNANQECIQWLDTQLPNSVLYVALGSIASLVPAEMHALALGLEASGHPFLWVIRRDSISSSLSDALPEGFLQRTVEKGLARIISWAPQMEVLRHCAVGAFFSHCGWNSTLESMWEGVPMVACPRAAEQRSNARWIVENWKIGVEVERQQDGSFTKEAVQSALQSVLTTEGTDYKERALQAKRMARSAVQKGGASYTNLVSFLNGLRH